MKKVFFVFYWIQTYYFTKDFTKDFGQDFTKDFTKDFDKDFTNDFTKDFTKDFNKDLSRAKRPMRCQFSKFMGETKKKYGFGSVALRILNFTQASLPCPSGVQA